MEVGEKEKSRKGSLKEMSFEAVHQGWTRFVKACVDSRGYHSETEPWVFFHALDGCIPLQLAVQPNGLALEILILSLYCWFLELNFSLRAPGIVVHKSWMGRYDLHSPLEMTDS